MCIPDAFLIRIPDSSDSHLHFQTSLCKFLHLCHSRIQYIHECVFHTLSWYTPPPSPIPLIPIFIPKHLWYQSTCFQYLVYTMCILHIPVSPFHRSSDSWFTFPPVTLVSPWSSVHFILSSFLISASVVVHVLFHVMWLDTVVALCARTSSYMYMYVLPRLPCGHCVGVELWPAFPLRREALAMVNVHVSHYVLYKLSTCIWVVLW